MAKKAKKEEENKLNITKFPLNELVKDEVKEMNVLLKDKNVECYLDNEVNVMADKEEIMQVVVILLDNSNKYVDENGTIKISVEKQGKFAKFEISNSYKDVKNVDTKRIFDRFYREDKARSRENGGSGLGLSIAYMITQLHGGSIKITKNEPKGTKITVKI